MLELSSMRRLLSFKVFALERVDWIKLFLGICVSRRIVNVLLEAGSKHIIRTYKVRKELIYGRHAYFD